MNTDSPHDRAAAIAAQFADRLSPRDVERLTALIDETIRSALRAVREERKHQQHLSDHIRHTAAERELAIVALTTQIQELLIECEALEAQLSAHRSAAPAWVQTNAEYRRWRGTIINQLQQTRHARQQLRVQRHLLVHALLDPVAPPAPDQ